MRVLRLWPTLSILGTLGTGFFAMQASAQLMPPEGISFQAFVTDDVGTPIEGVHSTTVKLFDVEVGTTEVWTRTYSPNYAGGVANLILEDGSPDLGTLAFDRPRWLEVTVESDVQPRIPLQTVPYAHSLRGLRVFPAPPEIQTDRGYNLVGGHPLNKIGASFGGSTIGGGGFFSVPLGEFFNKIMASQGTIGGGAQNSVSGYAGTISGGQSNWAIALAATVGGGLENVASGGRSTIGGGDSNGADGDYATVGGGNSNTADGNRATVGGGNSNVADGDYAAVAGGRSNEALADSAAIGGGAGNSASGVASSISGGRQNSATGAYSAISGGWFNSAADSASVGGGLANSAGGKSSIGGGYANSAGTGATVGGGLVNNASGTNSVIGGGQSNSALGTGSTVPGGILNSAQGSGSFAAGINATAGHNNAFVWSDGNSLGSTANNQFLARAVGGFFFYTASGTSTGAELPSSSGSWSSLSSVYSKTDFENLSEQDILERLGNVDVMRWRYKGEDASIRHVGPMAQDFYSAFGLGKDDEHIATVDADGIALAAIKALRVQNLMLLEEIGELKRRLSEAGIPE